MHLRVIPLKQKSPTVPRVDPKRGRYRYFSRKRISAIPVIPRVSYAVCRSDRSNPAMDRIPIPHKKRRKKIITLLLLVLDEAKDLSPLTRHPKLAEYAHRRKK
jgi:hypothetical protein